jgi:hypothetical protein
MSEVYVSPNGMMRFIYDDDVASVVQDLGSLDVRRASHVEPCEGGWEADLSPVSGPTLGPFTTRKAALEAEVEWLKENRIPVPKE